MTSQQQPGDSGEAATRIHSTHAQRPPVSHRRGAGTSKKGRVYLMVPFSENAEAKHCGARWDPDLHLWWVDERAPEVMPHLKRWMHPAGAGPGSVRRAPPTSIITPRRDFSLPECSCPALPWEHCEHTAPPGSASA